MIDEFLQASSLNQAKKKNGKNFCKSPESFMAVPFCMERLYEILFLDKGMNRQFESFVVP